MTTQKSFKRLVRARMEKTGESYTAARWVLLAADEPAGANGPPRATSNEAIRQRTGRGWEQWFDLLDEWGAAELGHIKPPGPSNPGRQCDRTSESSGTPAFETATRRTI